MTKLLLAWVFVLGLAPQAPTTYYVNIDDPNCADVTGAGTQERPYCTMRYTASVAWPGREYIISSKRDWTGPVEFTRSGTSTAPIIWRSTTNTVIGCFTDIRDEDFVATAVPGVFSMAAPAGIVWQTFYPKIVVDDPNPSYYEMVDTDGPLALAAAPDDTVLATIEGTFRRDATTGILRVHPYGSRMPSITATDFVVQGGRCVQFTTNTKFNVFDGFTITYGSIYNFAIKGTGNIVRNTKWIGVPGSISGTGNTLENYSATHVHARDASGNWLWHLRGTGLTFDVNGANHRLMNGRAWHSWNVGISTEDVTGGVVIDGFTGHGSPNHCGVGTGGALNVTGRNITLYNCQDYQWLYDTQNMIMEHMSLPGGGIALSSNRRTLGPITVRNSIFSGTIRHVVGLQVPFANQGCTWEKGSVMENNIISTTATIERCDPTPTTYPILTYMAKCASGEFTDCMTIRNNQLVDPANWKSVMKDGMWSEPLNDSWDVNLVPQSPAIDFGVASGATTDIVGTARPQGIAMDAGVYEVVTATPVDCVVSEWSGWLAGPWTVAHWQQTRTDTRARTITTPPANGGASCPPLTESRTVTQACQSITITPSLGTTCNPASTERK